MTQSHSFILSSPFSDVVMKNTSVNMSSLKNFLSTGLMLWLSKVRLYDHIGLITEINFC